MKNCNRTGNRKSREQFYRKRVPNLGYYFIVTDTKETEQNYMFGLRDSIPKELQGKLVIKVKKTSTSNLADKKLREHIADGKNKPSEQNPGTTVHILVNEIKAKIQR